MLSFLVWLWRIRYEKISYHHTISKFFNENNTMPKHYQAFLYTDEGMLESFDQQIFQ